MFCWNKRKKLLEEELPPKYNNKDREINDREEIINISVKNFQTLLEKIEKLNEKIDRLDSKKRPNFNNTNDPDDYANLFDN